MGSIAVTIGDLTTHASAPLNPGPGSPNVKFGGKNAWRAIIDVHNCPMSDPSPHGPGNVIQGSKTVLINGFPAVRVGDKVIDRGANPIVSGINTVMIG